jgi:hypothetical protein
MFEPQPKPIINIFKQNNFILRIAASRRLTKEEILTAAALFKKAKRWTKFPDSGVYDTVASI